MSKTDRYAYIRAVATRPTRVLSALASAHFTPAQAARVLRRTCPRLAVNSVN